MKRFFASLFLIGNFFGEATTNAQTIEFHRVDSIPVLVNGIALNNAWAGGINFPVISEIDLNGDGIHDLFWFDRSNNRISTFLNDGTPGVNAWHYAPQYVSRFPPINGWARLYDFNCDGKADLFTLGSCWCGIAAYRNEYNAVSGLHFKEISSLLMDSIITPPVNVYADQVFIPAFGDVDGDGDMDIVGFNSFYDGSLRYYKNNSAERGHGCDSLDFRSANSHWGKFKLRIDGIGSTISVQCFNCRQSQPGGHGLHDFSPEHFDQNKVAFKEMSSIFLLDANGDGTKDLLIGSNGSTNSLLVTNGGTPDSAVMVSQDVSFPSYDTPVNIPDYAVHSYIDLDNDGIKDLLVSPSEFENYRGMLFYKNTARNDSPAFHFQNNSFLVDQMIDVGEGACPVLFDADGDGLKDLVVGNYGIYNSLPSPGYTNSLHLFKNTGTAAVPAFELVNKDFANISTMGLIGPLFPAFGDLDGDGDEDMILGNDAGRLIYFENTGGQGNPAVFNPPVYNYMHLFPGRVCTPQLIDLNRDGLLDLVIGNKNGNVKYYQNTGTPNVPVFDSVPTVDALGGIDVRLANTPYGYSVPFVFDEHGQYKMLVSCEKGDVYLFDKIDDNLHGTFHLTDTVLTRTQGTRFGFNLAVSGGDLNNDSLPDMLLGIYSGGVSVYMQSLKPAVAELPPAADPGFSIAPNPSAEECLITFVHLLPAETNLLEVYNCMGQKIISLPVKTDQLLIDTRKLSSGVYMIQLRSSNKSVSQKLMVTH